MSFRLVYDVVNAGYHDLWMPLGMGLLFTAVGAALVFAPELMLKLMPGGVLGRGRVVFSWVLFLFAMSWTGLISYVTISDTSMLRSASSNRTCEELDGVVTDFVPMPVTGHALETFTVNGVPFGYSNYVTTGGFNNTASHGGPIRQGLPVRICFVKSPRTGDNIIVRLEVAS